MIKGLRQYRSVPPTGLVDVNDLLDDSHSGGGSGGGQVDVTSLLEENVSKKKAVSVGGGSSNTTSNIGGTTASQSQSTGYDPVKSLLDPLRQQQQQAQSAFEPLRYRATSDQTRAANVPVDVRNQMFNQSDFHQKQVGQQQANFNLEQTHNVIKQELGDVKKARTALANVKQKNGGVVPKDNETASVAIPSIKDYDNLSNDIIKNKGLVGAAVNEELKSNPTFANQYKILGGKIPKSYEGSLLYGFMQRHGQNIQTFVEEHPEYKNEFDDITNNFAQKYPETTAAQIGNEVSQAYEKNPKYRDSFGTFTSDDKKINAVANDLYKNNPEKLALYNNLVKDNKAKYFKSAAALNSFGGEIFSGLNSSMNFARDLVGNRNAKDRAFDALDKEATNINPNATGIRDWVSQSSGFLGMMTQLASAGGPLKGLGAAEKASEIIPVASRFYDDQLKDAQGRFGDTWKAKASADISTALFSMGVRNAIPLKKISGAVDNILKDASDKASVSSMRERISNAIAQGIKTYGQGVGEMYAITAGQNIADAGLGQPHEGAAEEMFNSAKTAAKGLVIPSLIHGVGAYAGTKVEKPLTDEPTQSKPYESIFPKTEENGQPTDITTPTTGQTGAEVRDTKDEQAGVNTTDNGLQDGNGGGGKDVGGKGVVYHGTNKEFDTFEPQGLGVHFGTEAQAKERGSRIIKATIDLKNPFRMEDVGSDYDVARLADELLDAGIISKEKKEELQKDGSTEDIKNILKENGYDGIVYKNRNEDRNNPTDSYIVFDKDQIKTEPTNETSNTISTGKEDVGGEKVDEPSDEFSNFKNHVLDTVLDVKDNKFEHTFSFDMDYKTREQAVRNIKEGKDTKAAQQMLKEIKQMYDDGYMYLNRGRGNNTERIQIPIKDYMAEVNKPFVPETDLEHLNTLLGEDSFNDTFDKHYNDIKNETEREGTVSETTATPAGETTEANPKIASGESESNTTPNQPIEPTNEGQSTSQKPPVEEGGASEEKTTGIKNAISENTRETFGLPKVELPKVGTDVERLQEGKRLVDSGEINPQDVIDKIIKGDGKVGMQPEEAQAMAYHSYQLKQHEIEIRKRMAEAETEEEKATANQQLQQLSDMQDRATQANELSGTAWSSVGHTRAMTIDDGFNPSREKSYIKDAYGGEIPKDVQLKIDQAIKERDEAIAAKNKAEEEYKQKIAEMKVNGMKKERTPRSKSDFKGRRKDLKEELKQAKEKHEQWLKDNGIHKAGVGFTLTPEMIKIIGKLAKTYVDEGFEVASEIISKIHEEVKDVLDGVSKKDIRDALALYESERLNKGAERRENKLATNKTEDFIQHPKPSYDFSKNTEWVKATQRIANAEQKIRNEKRKAFESQKNMFQKSLMWMGRLIRLSLLSGYNVLAKLGAAATIGAAGKRIPEQAIGRVYAMAFRGISEKAPIEGYHAGLDAELKWYKEFFNPKKFAINAWEIIKTGESHLSKKMGGGGYEHIPILYLPTDLHQIIKDPVKRGQFEHSLANGLRWADKNGMDIHDPLVIQSLETAAYKRALYEIFQEKNWLSNKFTTWKARMETKGNLGALAKFVADFMIPVSTVPTNIVRRLATTSPVGLIRGTSKVLKAYREGIENLKPQEADAVMRQLKQGTLGTALWLVGWFGYTHFGGLYSKYDPNKKRKFGDMSSDEMEVGGVKYPKPVQHALPLEIIQLAATSRRVYENYHDRKGANPFQATYEAGMASIGAMAEQIPVVETGAHVIGAFSDPYEASKLEEDVTRRFEPQILRETGVIGKKQQEGGGGGATGNYGGKTKPHKSSKPHKK